MHRFRRGLTLAEAVIALFVLASGFATLFLLFHSGSRYATMAENQSMAVQVAERALERVRGWSRKVHGPTGTERFDESSWSTAPLPMVATEDPDFPGFLVRGSSDNRTLHSPCSLFDALRDPENRRTLTHSVRRVEIHVTWGARAQQTSLFGGTVEHVLVSLVALPTGNPDTGRIDSVDVSAGGSIAHDDSRTLTPSSFDGQGRALPDLFFHSAVTSINSDAGFGTLVSRDRDRQVQLKNGVDVGSGTPMYSPGQCGVDVVARYCGRLINKSSDPLDLD